MSRNCPHCGAALDAAEVGSCTNCLMAEFRRHYQGPPAFPPGIKLAWDVWDRTGPPPGPTIKPAKKEPGPDPRPKNKEAVKDQEEFAHRQLLNLEEPQR